MPKRLLLILLLLLIGGYFFLGGGSPSKEALPSLSLKPVVSPSERGYLVGVDGTLNLPGEKEYNVTGSVWVKADGVKVKEQTVSTLVKGPSTLPLSLAGVEVSSTNVSVGADLTVVVDKREMTLSMESPVTFPPKSSLFLLPSAYIYPTSITPLEDGYEVSLKVVLSNPNDFAVKVSSASVKVGESSYPLAFSSIDPKGEASSEITVTVEGNTMEGMLNAVFEWSGIKKTLSQSFSISFPSTTPPQPIFRLVVSDVVAKPDGLSFKASLEINNPSFLPVSYKKVLLVVEKGDVKKEVTLGEDVSVPPYQSKELNASVDALPFFSGGKAYVLLLEGDEEKMPLEVPLELFNLEILPPKAYLWVDEVNEGAYIVNVKLENPNDFNLLIRDLTVEGYFSDTKIFDYNTPDFVLEDVWIHSEGDENSPVALVRGTELVLKLNYGLETYGVFYPLEVRTYADRPS